MIFLIVKGCTNSVNYPVENPLTKAINIYIYYHCILVQHTDKRLNIKMTGDSGDRGPLTGDRLRLGSVVKAQRLLVLPRLLPQVGDAGALLRVQLL